jgi:hypothetical protein
MLLLSPLLAPRRSGVHLTWLNDAILYEIYPQSFADSNSDGVGDLAGVLEHLDYLEWLGVNTIWFNPCFASPFRDAGYDVSDYLQIAPRYGTSEDMVRLVQAARERGMRVLLDLVAGHTSVAHAWFLHSSNDRSDDRSIWAERPGEGFVPSPGSRRGFYRRNFFDERLALNFGYARMDPDEPWRQPVDARGPQRNREALREIIAFWLARGVAGFRVDMAYSLVKDDPDLSATTTLWRQIREWLDDAYPDAILLPESQDPAPRPDIGVVGGFHGDFFLVNQQAHSALFNNGGAGSLFWLPDHEHCFFDADGRDGPVSLGTFLTIWDQHQSGCGGSRPVVLASADHDYPAGVGRPDRRAARRGLHLPADVGNGPVDLLRRRDRHAVRSRPARPRGQRLLPRLQPRWLPHADAMGRVQTQRGLLRCAPVGAVPTAGPRARPPDGRRPNRRSPLDAQPCPAPDRPAPQHARLSA